jgi:hypothetical protein
VQRSRVLILSSGFSQHPIEIVRWPRRPVMVMMSMARLVRELLGVQSGTAVGYQMLALPVDARCPIGDMLGHALSLPVVANGQVAIAMSLARLRLSAPPSPAVIEPLRRRALSGFSHRVAPVVGPAFSRFEAL